MTQKVTVLMPDEMKAELEKQAQTEKRSLSAQIVFLLAQILRRKPTPK